MDRAVTETNESLRPRARQNVVFELGYFVGKVSRNRVAALVRGSVEKPSDIQGVVYIDYDAAGAWKLQLTQELVQAGLKPDVQGLLVK